MLYNIIWISVLKKILIFINLNFSLNIDGTKRADKNTFQFKYHTRGRVIDDDSDNSD